jgi:hypothetical protein
MKNIKSKLSTICAIIIAVSVPVGVLIHAGTIPFPVWANDILICIDGIAAALIGVMTGRNSDGSIKSDGQLSSKQPNI